MSYGPDLREKNRIGGTYVGRILKGEKPADLAVEQATRVELAVNMKTTKSLGMTFLLSLLSRADEVIGYVLGTGPISGRLSNRGMSWWSILCQYC
jgi:putative ABC transport system substrate-binding protein